jgi:hypothetical protein
MERAAYQPDLRPRTLPELLDLAFRLYRTWFRHYVSMIAFLFFGLGAFGLNYLNMGFLIALAARRRGQEVANTP